MAPENEYEIEFKLNTPDSELTVLNFPAEKKIAFTASQISAIEDQEVSSSSDFLLLGSLFFTFYTPGEFEVGMHFPITFSLKHKKVEEQLIEMDTDVSFMQTFEKKMLIDSVPPFQVTWSLIRAPDPFLKTDKVQKETSSNIRQNILAERITEHEPLKTSLGKPFKVCCSLKSMSESLTL